MKYRFFDWIIDLNEVTILEDYNSYALFVYLKNGQRLHIDLHREEDSSIKKEKEKLFRVFEELDS